MNKEYIISNYQEISDLMIFGYPSLIVHDQYHI